MDKVQKRGNVSVSHTPPSKPCSVDLIQQSNLWYKGHTQEKKQSLRPNTVLTTADTHLNPNNTYTDHSKTIWEAIKIIQHYHNVKCEGRQTAWSQASCLFLQHNKWKPWQNVNASPCSWHTEPKNKRYECIT